MDVFSFVRGEIPTFPEKKQQSFDAMLSFVGLQR
jgi:hypothetical protein